jgi:tRNA pseudouridine13 synthase
MFGSKMRRAQQEAGALESEIEAETGLTDAEWRKANTEGTRRLGRLLLPDLRPAAHPDGLVVEFFLPKGGFATTVLREIMKGVPESLSGALSEAPDESGDGEM